MELNFVFKLVKYGQSGIQSSTLVTFHTEKGRSSRERYMEYSTLKNRTTQLYSEFVEDWFLSQLCPSSLMLLCV